MRITAQGGIDISGFGILVHGGAGSVSPPNRERHEAGCRRAAELAGEVLRGGGSAMDAVQRAVEMLEDDPTYNAGTGGSLNELGDVAFDAAVMDGESLYAGGVCALSAFKNPIAVARAVCEARGHVLYAADGADQFAKAAGFEPVRDGSMVTAAAQARLEKIRAAGAGAQNWAGGTVGAVAVDVRGHVAAATSTGGMMGKKLGRIGDSPLLGAGTYADDASGAVSATGEGEGIMRACLSFAILDAVRRGEAPVSAAAHGVETMAERVGAIGGVILATPGRGFAWARTTDTMSWAAQSNSALVSGI